jgi:hypothetical protein
VGEHLSKLEHLDPEDLYERMTVSIAQSCRADALRRFQKATEQLEAILTADYEPGKAFLGRSTSLMCCTLLSELHKDRTFAGLLLSPSEPRALGRIWRDAYPKALETRDALCERLGPPGWKDGDPELQIPNSPFDLLDGLNADRLKHYGGQSLRRSIGDIQRTWGLSGAHQDHVDWNVTPLPDSMFEARFMTGSRSIKGETCPKGINVSDALEEANRAGDPHKTGLWLQAAARVMPGPHEIAYPEVSFLEQLGMGLKRIPTEGAEFAKDLDQKFEIRVI